MTEDDMVLDHAPMTPFMDERVPGMAPITHADWLHRDAAFAPQSARPPTNAPR